MRPILVSWRGLRIHSYPALLYAGMALGIVAADYAANVSHLDSARTVLALVLLTIPGLVGGRLLFVVTHWDSYRADRSRVWRRSEGGAALQGGLLLVLAASVPLLAALGLPFGPFWDVATFGILIQLVFARFGCLLNGCCSGRPTESWCGLCLPDHRGIVQRRIPSQLLEAGWAILVLVAAVALWGRRPFGGAVFLSALAAYAIGRIGFERLRDSRSRIRGLDVQQLLAVLFAVLAFVGAIVGWLTASSGA
jgi:phosphatidylglycerol:prolipoprotein diacylglycerol transferase